MDVTSLFPTTSINGISSTAVLPTRTLIVNRLTSSGLMYEPSTTIAVVFMEPLSTMIPVMVTDMPTTSVESSSVVASNPTGDPDETSSSSSDIGAVIGSIVGVIVLCIILVICFVIIMANKRTRTYKIKVNHQPETGRYGIIMHYHI